MDSVREIISNLDIYKDINFIPKENNNPPPKQPWGKGISPFGNKKKVDKNNINKIIKVSPAPQSSRRFQINLRSDVNFIELNKEKIKEQESKNREEKLKKENDKLKLIIQQKQRKQKAYTYVPPRLYEPRAKSQNHKIRTRSNSSEKGKKGIKYVGGLNSSVLDSRVQSSKQRNEPILHKDFGKTPEYLEKMKEELRQQKEEKKREEREKKLPKGTKFLSEEERSNRMNELTEMKKDLECELFKMPIVRLTLKMTERKAEIEKNLNDIENEMNRLSYKDVVVQI